jgi:hypothetical protein
MVFGEFNKRFISKRIGVSSEEAMKYGVVLGGRSDNLDGGDSLSDEDIKVRRGFMFMSGCFMNHLSKTRVKIIFHDKFVMDVKDKEGERRMVSGVGRQ